MKEKFLDKTIYLIGKYQDINEGDTLDKIRYGLEGIYLTFTKMIVIFLLAFLLGIVKEVIILLVFFNILRFTGFGFHAKTSLECLIISILSFVLLPLLFLKTNFGEYGLLILGGLGTIYLFLYAPADTIKRPLPNVKKRKIRKMVTVCEAIIFTGLAVYFRNYDISKILICSIIVESIMVSPITYKLMRQSYRNYLNYKKA